MVNNESRGVGDVVFLVPARRRRAWGRRSDPRARMPPLERGMPCTMGLTAFRASLSVVTHRSGDRRAGGYAPRQCGPSLRECGLRWEPPPRAAPTVGHVSRETCGVLVRSVSRGCRMAVRGGSDPGYSRGKQLRWCGDAVGVFDVCPTGFTCNIATTGERRGTTTGVGPPARDARAALVPRYSPVARCGWVGGSSLAARPEPSVVGWQRGPPPPARSEGRMSDNGSGGSRDDMDPGRTPSSPPDA